jgi:hypothetical protein
MVMTMVYIGIALVFGPIARVVLVPYALKLEEKEEK